jgi:hypothetical protein
MYPVRGQVTVGSGTPVTKGLVVFESTDGTRTARGPIGPDGRYEISTLKRGDGAYPGTYRVLINPADLSDVPDEQKNLPFDHKYLRFDTSELEVTVHPTENDIPLTLDPPKKRAK